MSNKCLEYARWGPCGGLSILTLRSLVQSRSFEHAWPLLAKSYRTSVSCPDNVVPLRRAVIHYRNCSPLAGCGLGVVHPDHVGGVAGECDLDGDDGVVVERGHGTEIA